MCNCGTRESSDVCHWQCVCSHQCTAAPTHAWHECGTHGAAWLGANYVLLVEAVQANTLSCVTRAVLHLVVRMGHRLRGWVPITYACGSSASQHSVLCHCGTRAVLHLVPVVCMGHRLRATASGSGAPRWHCTSSHRRASVCRSALRLLTGGKQHMPLGCQ